ncbi:MAG: molybdopterin cofactor-binding domain-containing protein [Steroidobacteraceae bacterium]
MNSSLTRRSFLAVSLAAGGGMLIGFSLRAVSQSAPPAPKPNAFIRIDESGRVTLILPYVEMGQGAYTSQIQILAEELEVDPAVVTLEAAPANEALYASPLLGEQITGGSASLRGAWLSMRAAGAASRMMLVSAAARRWKVRSSMCRAEQGRVLHPSGKSFYYGELAAEAAKLPVPAAPVLKNPASFRVIGQPQKRVEGPTKLNGTAKFGIDMRPVGVLHAMVNACPVFGGKLANIDASAALQIKGVRQIVQIDDAVAVVADHTWAALKGLRALKVQWIEGPNSQLTTADLIAAADAALDRDGLIAENIGDTTKAEASAARRFEVDYRMPILAHAAMEPLSCTVHVTPERCDIWAGSQIVGRAHKVAVEATGIAPEKVFFHNQLLGGGFGRRLETDYVRQAVLLAKQVNAPVKVTWSREEDMQHDYYRFLNHSRVVVGLDAAGQPVSWRHRVVAPNIMARFLPIYQKDNVDLDAVDAASGPYDIANVFVDFSRNEAPAGLCTGNWRGVGPTRNVFVVEGVIDELAHQAGRDPISYRKALMTKATRARVALEMVERESGWREPLPERSGRGVAVFSAFGSYLAMVAQVRVEPSGQVRVERVVCAVDTGIVVNPDIVRAQIEGGVIFGISAVLYGRITIANGRVQQGNFDTYPVLRMSEAPRIDVHIVKSSEDPGGVGEPGTSGVIAAVANAVFAATGKRVRTLPIDSSHLRSA